MYPDTSAIAYTASWCCFFYAEFASRLKIDFFTSSRQDVHPLLPFRTDNIPRDEGDVKGIRDQSLQCLIK
ncbi:MAG: hypothetical protein QOI94_2221, partial [Acidobacteriaceae bacterium]|nr:hypothetical protein [Acidobacteriaceae bacterium]